MGFNTKLLIVNFLLHVFVLTDQPNAKVSSFSSGSPYSGHMSIWLLAIENLSGVNNQGLIGSFIKYEFASFYQLQYAGACMHFFFVFLFLAFRFKRKKRCSFLRIDAIQGLGDIKSNELKTRTEKIETNLQADLERK